MNKFIVLLLFFCFSLSAQEINVIFAGLIKGSGPSFEQRYQDAVREKLAMSQNLHLVDQLDTKKLLSMVNFYDFPYISRNAVNKLMRYSPDSTLIVWGRTENFRIHAKKRGLWRAQPVGSVSIVLTMFSLNYEEYAFIGKVDEEFALERKNIGFNRVDKVMHITADERSRLTDNLSRLVADKTVKIINAVVKNRLLKEGPLVDLEQNVEEVPSIFDILDMPSVEGENIEQTK